jgi:hypothetical protein
VKNIEVLHGVQDERNILHTVRRRKANWIGHILRRNCLVKHVVEGKIEVTVRRGKDVGSCWMTLKRRNATVYLKKKHYIAL